MIWIPAAMVLGGLVLLSYAADRFVVAAARLSRHWGMSPILIGALIVGMGTSAPELVVSLFAALEGQLDLAIGNAVGSNVANVTLVLGGTAILAPIAGDERVLKREGLLMLVAVIGFAAVLLDLRVSRVEGIGLAASMVLAGLIVVRWAQADKRDGLSVPNVPATDGGLAVGKELFIGLLALGGTLLGADLLVRGGVEIAAMFGVPEAFVGMTLVSVGTSLPELATSIAGIRRQEHNLVLGNVLGSNLFNALAVGGVAGAIAPGPIDGSFVVGAVAMVVCAAVAGLLAFTGRLVVRWEGILLVLGFAGFVYLTYT
jgi:cation:H+ antiporter